MDEVEQEQQLTQGSGDNNSNVEEDSDDLEWHKIISNPQVLSEIRRLATEARR